MLQSISHCDDLGPEKVIQIYDARTDLHAVVVIDNVAIGPAIGGVRMAADVSVEECVRLARAMTLKNAAAGIVHGGGKAVIAGDPSMAASDKERLLRSFASAIREINSYIPGPDMGTDEAAMAWINDVNGRAAGMPRELGGIPLDEIGITGFGLGIAIEVAQEYSDVHIEGARFVVQGFGCVGSHVARFLEERGGLLVAAADSRGACGNENGIEVQSLIDFKMSGQSVADYPDGKPLVDDGILDVDCDIWIPAARPDVITPANVDRLRAKIVAEGANIPVSIEAEHILAARDVLVLPDFIVNAGGVICAAVEIQKGTETQAFEVVEEKIRSNTHAVLASARDNVQAPRHAAQQLARERVLKAMSYRRSF